MRQEVSGRQPVEIQAVGRHEVRRLFGLRPGQRKHVSGLRPRLPAVMALYFGLAFLAYLVDLGRGWVIACTVCGVLMTLMGLLALPSALIVDERGLSARFPRGSWRAVWSEVIGLESRLLPNGTPNLLGPHILKTVGGPLPFTGDITTKLRDAIETVAKANRAAGVAPVARAAGTGGATESGPPATEGMYRLGQGGQQLTLAKSGLTVRRGRRTSRQLPWHKVIGVRWLSSDQAEVLTDSWPVRLPAGTENLPGLVAAIEAAALENQAALRQHGLPQAQIREYLRLGAGSRLRDDTNRRCILWNGLGLVALAVAWALMTPSYVTGVLAVLLPRLSAGLWRALPVLEADGREVRCTGGGQNWSFEWHDLDQVTVRRDDGKIVFGTRHGEFAFAPGTTAHVRLYSCASRVVAANQARFATAGEVPVPDTALSPARLTETEAERGLTRVDR